MKINLEFIEIWIYYLKISIKIRYVFVLIIAYKIKFLRYPHEFYFIYLK